MEEIPSNHLTCMKPCKYQGIVGCTPTNVPLWEIPIYGLYSGYLWVSYPQESLENTINTMGTPHCPLKIMGYFPYQLNWCSFLFFSISSILIQKVPTNLTKKVNDGMTSWPIFHWFKGDDSPGLPRTWDPLLVSGTHTIPTSLGILMGVVWE